MAALPEDVLRRPALFGPMTETAAKEALMAPPDLALLRRYFRAVLGDQQSGDRLVAAVRPALPPVDRSMISLFAAATRAWRRLHSSPVAKSFTAGTLAQAVSPSASLPRQAGVLTDVFGLPTGATALILGMEEADVERLLTEIRTSRRAPLGCSVLVVEDDPMIAAQLVMLAEARGAVVAESARSHDAALRKAAVRPPDIVMCDYDLAEEKTGIDVVRTLTEEYDSVSIFVTAYPEEVLTGADSEPSFIISKPFRENVVEAALWFAATSDRPALLAA